MYFFSLFIIFFLQNHRISVRAVTENGSSADASCTVTVGKGNRNSADRLVHASFCSKMIPFFEDALVSPQEIKATHVTPVSAQISWYPSNSNYEHIVLLNGLKVGSCPSGIYQILLKGIDLLKILRFINGTARETNALRPYSFHNVPLFYTRQKSQSCFGRKNGRKLRRFQDSAEK